MLTITEQNELKSLGFSYDNKSQKSTLEIDLNSKIIVEIYKKNKTYFIDANSEISEERHTSKVWREIIQHLNKEYQLDTTFRDELFIGGFDMLDTDEDDDYEYFPDDDYPYTR